MGALQILCGEVLLVFVPFAASAAHRTHAHSAGAPSTGRAGSPGNGLAREPADRYRATGATGSPSGATRPLPGVATSATGSATRPLSGVATSANGTASGATRTPLAGSAAARSTGQERQQAGPLLVGNEPGRWRGRY